jgi:hypothetical protein
VSVWLFKRFQWASHHQIEVIMLPFSPVLNVCSFYHWGTWNRNHPYFGGFIECNPNCYSRNHRMLLKMCDTISYISVKCSDTVGTPISAAVAICTKWSSFTKTISEVWTKPVQGAVCNSNFTYWHVTTVVCIVTNSFPGTSLAAAAPCCHGTFHVKRGTL